MAREGYEDYTLIDVVEAYKNAGAYSANVLALRNFLILNDEYFDSDDYADFIDGMNEIRDLYIKEIAYEKFYKTPDQLTEAERFEVWDSLTPVDKTAICKDNVDALNDHGLYATQTYENGYPVFTACLRNDAEYTINYVTEHGIAPEGRVVSSLKLTEELLPTLTADGYVHTGWVDFTGTTVAVGQGFAYSPTLMAVWEEAGGADTETESLIICEKQVLVDIADAIRAKTGSTDGMALSEMASEISGISGISGSADTVVKKIDLTQFMCDTDGTVSFNDILMLMLNNSVTQGGTPQTMEVNDFGGYLRAAASESSEIRLITVLGDDIIQWNPIMYAYDDDGAGQIAFSCITNMPNIGYLEVKWNIQFTNGNTGTDLFVQASIIAQ